MSIEAAEPKLSKEEKKAKKEEKRRKKEAAAAAAAAASAVTSVAEVPLDEVAKKEKKDKKRKRAEEAAASEPAAPATVSEEDSSAMSKEQRKKEKKEKKRKEREQAESAATSQPAAVPAAARSSTAPAAAPVVPQAFTAAHNTYLESNNITLNPSLYPPTLAIAELSVNASIQTFLKRFEKPTPIQACTWPALLAGRDVVGIAETGSGKTYAFGVPGLHRIAEASASGSSAGAEKPKKKKKQGSAKPIRMLVVAPTRELALQSHENLELLGKEMGVGSVCLFGGVSKDEQIRALNNGVGVVVGTPGRVLDLADSGDLDLSNVSYMVLDEADRMLDQGFENDIRRIFAHCPGKEGRQTVMFSATWPESVRRLAGSFLNDPVRVTVGSDELSANKRIEQVVEVLDDGRAKDSRMLHHLKAHLKAHPSTAAQPTRILVFALYKKEAQRIESTLQRNRFKVAGLHGDMGQNERFRALDAFKKGEVEVLVATDVAARGLDIPDVGLVLNVTFPLTTEDFVHRCGRTGRAGKSGKAVTFFTGENHERSLAGEFMRVLRDVGAEVPKEMDRFPSTIKKKEHGSYGAFYRDTTNAPKATKITFD